MGKLYLGTREVTPAFIHKKYNVDVDNFLGNVDSNGIYQIPTELCDIVFKGVVGIGNYGMKYLFDSSSRIKSVSFPDLETATGAHALYCAFTDCSTLETFSCPKLKTIGGYACYSSFVRTGIKVLNFESLTTVGGSGLSNACYESHIEEIYFPKLDSIGAAGLGSLLRNTSSFAGKTISFPALKSTSFNGATNNFNNMLQNVQGVTVHFPSNLQSVIGSWSDVTNGFGGINTTTLFDLPATS